PFGETLSAPTDEIGYTGHKFDADLGLSYMQARYYDPVIGRFYANDPVSALTFIQQGNIQGFNRYAYANNNPYKYTDPNGESPTIVAGAGAGCAATGPGCPVGAVVGGAIGAIIGIAIADAAINHFNESADSSDSGETSSGSTETENKGQGQAEVGDCPTCGGKTSKKPGKIGQAHGLKPREVKDRIHGLKDDSKVSGNPDIEVCNGCGEVFPQTDQGTLGDSIGNIEEEF
ncbi:RHS repeat-associated core domain-containing protein, partial [Exilibacterium tricleocarpae]|uniref:RHS repeat-associated core domain-containing protein n=1 Tax=Exilibacterium tricleocarpae TaxID=2591008 RepID=UPI001C553BD8